jgi:hypothetical protein
MSLVHVQKWLAHLSPEMTLAYAKLLDSTRRKEWEQAFAKGTVRIDVEGRPKVVSTEQLGNEQEIEWEHIRHNLDAVRLPNGYCFKPRKANCPTQDTPCYTCRHFCTTPDFLPQFEHEEREMRELIELGQKAGSEIWIERNTQKLSRLLPVIQIIRSGDLHHPAGKAMREYTPEERATAPSGKWFSRNPRTLCSYSRPMGPRSIGAVGRYSSRICRYISLMFLLLILGLNFR